MANKWAIQNGNWSDGSTWNDGVVPTVDDDVWLNGKTIAVDCNSLNLIEVKSLHNDVCLETNLNGGYINLTNATVNNYLSIIADCYGDRLIGLIDSSTFQVNIIGSCYKCYFIPRNHASHLNITGNVENCLWMAVPFNSTRYFNIVGDVLVDKDNVLISNDGVAAGTYLDIVGNCDLKDNITYGPTNYILTIDGKLKIYVAEPEISLNSLSINGIFDISDIGTGKIPVPPGKTFNIGRQSVSYISQITDPDVPQSVVLEGYQYGDKVGTLKTVPDNVTIVNLTEQEVNRVKNCATVSTVQKCFEDFKEE